MLCHLAGYLAHQVGIGKCDQHLAVFTPQVQRVPPLSFSAHAQKPSAAAPTAQVSLESLGGTVLGLGIIGSLFLNDTLNGIKIILSHDGWIPVHPGVAGILQQTLYLVLVPEGSLRAERDGVMVEDVADFLIGQSIEVQRGDPLDNLRLLGDDGQLAVLDLIAV